MPYKLTRTTPANLPWGKSVQFNGINQYLSAPNNAAFQFGTGDFTIECWMNCSNFGTTSSYNRVLCVGSTHMLGTGTGAEFVIFASSSNTPGGITYNLAGNAGNINPTITGSNSAMTTNRWYHLAMTRQSGTMYGFIDGGLLSSVTNTASISGTSGVSIGAALSTSSYFSGSISNVRILKGTALYTASFTPLNSPLNVVANTSLLACHDTSFKDGSVNNFTITTSGTPSISTATPFVVSAKSVLFNGSTQYLTAPDNTAFNFGSSNFTIECWVNLSNYTSAQSIFTKRNVATTDTTEVQFYVFSNGLTLYVSNGTTWVINGVASTAGSFISNAWNHIALTRNGTEFAGYINGTKSVFGTSAATLVTNATSIAISSDQVSSWRNGVNGYVSNYRIVKGTALYTASFTALAEPLTSVASCSLLTCNSATIVDSSTNNFAITNNNTATVSSLVPFNVVGYGYKFKNANNIASVLAGTQKAIFGYGSTGTNTAITNLVSNTGVVATDTAGVGTARYHLAAAGYGNDKAIFGYGVVTTYSSLTNLVSNTGVVATDTTGVGTARAYLAAAGYGIDKAIFGYGADNSNAFSITNKVSNTGVVATDTGGVGTGRYWPAAAGYGIDKAIFGYGSSGGFVSMTNKVSNTGVVATDTTGVGSARYNLAAAGYGTDKALFGYGDANGVAVSMTNKVSNTGIVATDTTGVGTSRHQLAAAGYGSDKAIFGYGYTSVVLSMTNLVSNTGVVSTDTTGVGTSRSVLAAAGFSITTVPAPSGMNFKKVFADPIALSATQKAIFGYGYTTVNVSMTNLVSNTGVVANDTTGVGTARGYLAAAGYGTDKAIFGYGDNGVVTFYSMTNLVSNTGVVATDTTGVGTARSYLAAAGYGSDKAIFGYGYTTGTVSITNLVSNTGVVATNTTGVGTARNNLAAAGYGTNKAIFGYGSTTGGLGGNVSVTNLVSNTGVVATDTTGVGTARLALAAAGYGSDKAIFGYGQQSGGYSSMTNLVSNTGVVATDTTGVGTVRQGLAAAGYGSDKAIFAYGIGAGAVLSMSNLVSNTGVVATDTTGVGTARQYTKAAGYSLT
jgi:hypothetical protein